eukprot:TRINITY_DN15233_c0_g2_i1.p1 TRINITY_DN15233_c0_g2~~TRINITY_DN15233_c0_g2_i1.p1  ORF type:complete len:489 (+),score=70.07 TRINITY_DN15233_c0_g2_i1:128-1594(+)
MGAQCMGGSRRPPSAMQLCQTYANSDSPSSSSSQAPRAASSSSAAARRGIWELVAREEVQALGDIVQAWAQGVLDGATARRYIQVRVLRGVWPSPPSLGGSGGGVGSLAQAALRSALGVPPSAPGEGLRPPHADRFGSLDAIAESTQEEVIHGDPGGASVPGTLFAELGSMFGASSARSNSGSPSPEDHLAFKTINDVFSCRLHADARGLALQELEIEGVSVLPDDLREIFREKASGILLEASREEQRPPFGQAMQSAWLDLVRLCFCVEVLRHTRTSSSVRRGTPASGTLIPVQSPRSRLGLPRPMPGAGLSGPGGMDLVFVMPAGNVMVVGVGPGGAGGAGELGFGQSSLLQHRILMLLSAMQIDAAMGQRSTGLSQEMIDRYCPLRTRDSADACCPICLEDSVVGEQVRTLPCGHELHRDCCEAWLVNADTCPTCRHKIPGGGTATQVGSAAGNSSGGEPRLVIGPAVTRSQPPAASTSQFRGPV